MPGVVLSSCSASKLLSNAVSVGDCTSALASGSFCRNVHAVNGTYILAGGLQGGWGYCRGDNGGPDGERVNGRVKAGFPSELPCAAACTALPACVGYAYVFPGRYSGPTAPVGITQTPLAGRCWLHGAGLDEGLKAFNPEEDDTVSSTEWQGYFVANSTRIGGSSGFVDARCMQKGCSESTCLDGKLTPGFCAAPCDASATLANAMDAGDCSSSLGTGESCTNAASDGYTCSPSTCHNGTLNSGVCYTTAGPMMEDVKIGSAMNLWFNDTKVPHFLTFFSSSLSFVPYLPSFLLFLFPFLLSFLSALPYLSFPPRIPSR